MANPFLFGGVYFDEETGYYQMRHRYYDTGMRRFLSRDPAEDDTLGNLYAFTENNPGTHTDPTGLAINIGLGPLVGPAVAQATRNMYPSAIKKFLSRGNGVGYYKGMDGYYYVAGIQGTTSRRDGAKQIEHRFYNTRSGALRLDSVEHASLIVMLYKLDTDSLFINNVFDAATMIAGVSDAALAEQILAKQRTGNAFGGLFTKSAGKDVAIAAAAAKAFQIAGKAFTFFKKWWKSNPRSTTNDSNQFWRTTT